jgi:hypothetical protein
MAGIRTEMAADRAHVLALHRQIFYILASMAFGVISLLGVVVFQAV